jgi:feruloyl esterase
MIRTRTRDLVGALGLALLVQNAWARAPRDLEQACAAVAQLALPDTRILKTEAIHPAPRYAVPGTEQGAPRPRGPVAVTAPFCRVQGVVTPGIRFEVWLPLAGWNGRFQGLGVGAFLGALPYEPMAAALEQGYAVAGTDTGHQSGGADASWSVDAHGLDAQRVADWAHRGIHEMTIKSKAIVRALYGKPAGHSYFVGCSSGGHQALTEAQRYPADYDGILAGAPANYWTHLMAGQLWYGLATRTDPATDLEAPVSQLALIHAAALRACDAADGVRDGVIENPLACQVDPQALRCQPGQTQDCLSGPQIQALQKIYGDAHDRAGNRIFPGLAPGSESGWPAMSANQVSFAQTFYRYLVFQQPDWNYANMDFERDVATADQRIGGIVNSIDPDLRPFASRGGKLLQYHGWSDPLISPYNSVAYYESVLARFGAARDRGAALAAVQRFHRLFMVPGMAHCRGGEGTDTFDGLGALQRWVEQGEAPARLEAAKLSDGITVRTRPLCPYPQVARYQGRGSTDVAANFACVRP